jgi:DNA invertase Pin-like site-specific DNA recombinase
VYKLDRFARNQADHITVRQTLKKYHTELKSVTEPISDSPVGKMMEGILSAFAEFDNNVRTERSVNGMKERIKQGIWVWQAPMGYCRTEKGANLTPIQLTHHS